MLEVERLSSSGSGRGGLFEMVLEVGILHWSSDSRMSVCRELFVREMSVQWFGNGLLGFSKSDNSLSEFCARLAILNSSILVCKFS